MALKPPLPLLRLQPSVRFSTTTATAITTTTTRPPPPPPTPPPLNHLHDRNHRRLYSAPTSSSTPPSKQKYIPTSGTYPRGFLAAGLHVGIKPTNRTAPDLALIASTTPCAAAAVFTQNKFQAAPVVVSREILQRRGGQGIRAIVVNAGCANAVTGKKGIEDAEAMGREVDRCIAASEPSPPSSSPPPDEEDPDKVNRTLVMSTGVIGQPLPLPKILSHIPHAYTSLSDTHASWLTAARAICTTDTFPKLHTHAFTLPSSPTTTYHLAGMTKGAGMIHPNMATLLGILCTDLPIPPPDLPALLRSAVDDSFNSISIDGDTSTNDTVALLSNGAAGGPPLHPSDHPAFLRTLTSFSQHLARLVVRDGEGATKFITLRVANAASRADARRVAASVARSPLVKTAMYGRDANWGRILCATGYAAGVEVVDPERTSVSFRPADGSPELRLLVGGEPEVVDEVRAAEILEMEDLEIVVDLGVGKEEAVYWTCDFSHEYVTINGDYRT
ncbi:hypothetical protein FGG08_004795 [Glutinoglossum americanum]|uniref:Arginine biosynthesis bifunctional protein ArgJ, mitochondrial n=1 Tax=Glutinoglossum americanum TaxID=1670608 RepID=A0A9P8I1J8_9PEZI|nr:hypothetical protein FGG08_004795 [Glutinoglossum americanum]